MRRDSAGNGRQQVSAPGRFLGTLGQRGYHSPTAATISKMLRPQPAWTLLGSRSASARQAPVNCSKLNTYALKITAEISETPG